MGEGAIRLRRVFQAAAGLVIVALLVGLYRAKTDAGATQARVRALEAEITEIDADIRALRAESAALETPARVEELAEAQLRLRPGGAARADEEADLRTALPAPR